MNENILHLIERFTRRVHRLIEIHGMQLDQIVVLRQENEALQGKIIELQRQNEVLIQKNNLQKTAENIADVSGGKLLAMNKIDVLVREIDECITMLDD